MDAAKVDLMRALGRLVRGLSILLWALPVAVLLDVETARSDWLALFGRWAMIPSVAAGAILYYAIRQMRAFQKQERIWVQALHRAEMLAIVNTGLAPFLYWWHRFPALRFYADVCVALLTAGFLLLLLQINFVLRRLSAMLPDEPLREETKLFTALNTFLFSLSLLGFIFYLTLSRFNLLPRAVAGLAEGDYPRGLWLVLFLNLLPLTLTLAILWRIKEALYHSLFAAE
jgi:hypothetical protein